jgi:hypothetical protein
MININNIKIFVIENPDIPYLNDLGLFDYFNHDNNLFIGIAIDSTRLRDELDGTFNYTSHSITDTKGIDKDYTSILDSVLEYCGIELDIDNILDIMFDVDMNRKIYLESILYFKSNQKGKRVNNIQLTIEHFDDFANQFSEDIISHKVLSNNEDFSKTIVIIETHLTEKEATNKFNKFLIS